MTDTVGDQITLIQRRAELSDQLDSLEYIYQRVLGMLGTDVTEPTRLRALDYAWSLLVRGDVKPPTEKIVVMDHDHG